MEKKVALVTGGSSDIAKAIIKDLVKKNYYVYTTYNKTKTNYTDSNVVSLPCDLQKEEDILMLCSVLKETCKTIDLLICCAALCQDNTIEEKTKDEFIRVLDVNVVSVFLLVKHLKNELVNSGGVVLFISSTDGIDTYNEYNIDYSVSKAALIHLNKTLAYAIKGIKFYCLSLNFVDTKSIREMNPIFLEEELKRVGQKKLLKPSEVSKKVFDILEKQEQSGKNYILR